MYINECYKVTHDKDLIPEAVRLLFLVYQKLDENENCNLTRKEMEEEWKRAMGKTSQRKFCKGWNNLKENCYLIHHRDHINRFFQYWEVKTYAEAKRLRESKGKNNSNSGSGTDSKDDSPCCQLTQNVDGREKTVQTNTKTNNDLLLSLVNIEDIETSVKYVFDAYINRWTQRRITINGKKIGVRKIRERLQEAIDKGIEQKVIARVIKKIKEYQGKIMSLASYITACLFNTVQEWQEWEERVREEENNTVEIVEVAETKKEAEKNSAPMPTSTTKKANKKTMPYSHHKFAQSKTLTRFHNFMQRDTDYDRVLAQLNPFNDAKPISQELLNKLNQKSNLSEIDKMLLGQI